MVTENTPSYWHGWAPNNKEVLYVGQRNNIPVYNIYRNSIKGGKEVALTNIKEGQHVDGCEYSPDGKHIWFKRYVKIIQGKTMDLTYGKVSYLQKDGEAVSPVQYMHIER